MTKTIVIIVIGLISFYLIGCLWFRSYLLWYSKPDLDSVQLHPGYFHGTYQFDGKVTTTTGTYTFVSTFSGKTTSDTFDMEWVQDMGYINKVKGSVTITTHGGQVHITGLEDTHQDDPNMAIAMATGVSGGSAHLMYSLWTGDRNSIFPHMNTTVHSQDQGRIIVSGNGRSEAIKTEIVIDNGLLSSFSTIHDQNLDPPKKGETNISDDQIRGALKKMGRPITEEEITKIKTSFRVEENNKKHHSITLSTTVITIIGLNP